MVMVKAPKLELRMTSPNEALDSSVNGKGRLEDVSAIINAFEHVDCVAPR